MYYNFISILNNIFNKVKLSKKNKHLPFLCGAIVLGQLGFFTRGLMIGIALFRILGPANLEQLLSLTTDKWDPWDPLVASRLKTDMPTSAPTDNLLLPRRPTMSIKLLFKIVYFELCVYR